MPPNEQSRYERRVALARAGHDAATFDRAWQEGRTMTLEQSIELALEKTVERS
jgi:hypothetical protein